MSTSGVATFNMVASEIVEKAFHRLGKASEGEAMSPRMLSDGMSSLNLLIKGIGAADHLWVRTEGTVTLVADTAAYVLTPKPLRVTSVRRRYTSGTTVTDTPLTELSRQEYFEQPNKTSSPSTPNSYYFDPQATSGTLYLWPAASSETVTAGYSIQLTYLRRMDDMVSSNDDLDMPQEWLQPMIWALADDLETEYPVNDPRLAQKIERKSAMWYQMLRSFDNETASIFLQPEVRPWG
jgi:hypothetical protein